MMVDLSRLTTEQRNPATMDLDQMSPLEIAAVMNQEDKKAVLAVQQVLPQVATAIQWAADSLRQGGRLIYMGAGTSGRLGVLDAVECPPTFGSAPESVVGLIAGGDCAFVKAVEGAEDSCTLGAEDLQRIHLQPPDLVIGLAASGRTPYVIHGLRYARSIGCKTVAIACNAGSLIGQEADLAIEPVTGPEVLTGSTRLKAGTAQKLILNMISTGSMPEALDLVLSSFIALTLTGLITLFFIMPVAGLISDGILIFVTKLLEIGGVVTGFVLASIWLPIVMFGLHHFMTPIHIELINQTGMTVLLPILAQAGAGQVGAALAIWLKCRKNKPLVGIVKGGLPSGILGIGEPLIYGVTLPLGKPFLTACLGAGVGGAFIASFGNVGATSQAVSGILMLPVIADQKWFIYAGGLLLSYAAGFVLTYFFGVPKEAEQPADTLEELEMQ